MWNVSNRNFGLDVIRAIAILLVVLSHCTFAIPQFNTTITNAIRLLGATGVDIFFVLSGYLIGGILLKNIESGKTKFQDLFHFWKRRWLRTLPNYFVVLIINILLAFLFTRYLPNTTWLYFPFLQNFISAHPNFFTEAWSLSIEEYAYLFLPIIIYGFLFFKRNIQASRVFLLSTLILIGTLNFLKLEFYISSEINNYKDWSLQFRKVVIYRFDAIYYGFLLIYLMTKFPFFKVNKIKLFIIGTTLFIILHFLIVWFNVLPNNYKAFYTFFYLPLISLSIAFLFPFIIKLKSNLFKNAITYISKRSYSIYLVNYSIVLLSVKHFFEPSLGTVILYLFLTFLFAEVLYRYVEMPFLILREKWVS